MYKVLLHNLLRKVVACFTVKNNKLLQKKHNRKRLDLSFTALSSKIKSTSFPVHFTFIIILGWNSVIRPLDNRPLEPEMCKNDTYLFIYFSGECWSGAGTSLTFHRDGPSKNCRAENFDTCPCNSYHCVGMAKTNHVYKLIEGPGL